MKKAGNYPPEDFTPSLEVAKEFGMWESTYKWQCGRFKDTPFDPKNHIWERVWRNWCRSWVEGKFGKPMQQHGAPDANNSVKCFVLRKGNEKQAIAWLDYYNANNPEKYTFMIKNLKRIIEGWSDAICQVTSEYPPTHGNVVQLELYRSAV